MQPSQRSIFATSSKQCALAVEPGIGPRVGKTSNVLMNVVYVAPVHGAALVSGLTKP